MLAGIQVEQKPDRMSANSLDNIINYFTYIQLQMPRAEENYVEPDEPSGSAQSCIELLHDLFRINAISVNLYPRQMYKAPKLRGKLLTHLARLSNEDSHALSLVLADVRAPLQLVVKVFDMAKTEFPGSTLEESRAKVIMIMPYLVGIKKITALPFLPPPSEIAWRERVVSDIFEVLHILRYFEAFVDVLAKLERLKLTASPECAQNVCVYFVYLANELRKEEKHRKMKLFVADSIENRLTSANILQALGRIEQLPALPQLDFSDSLERNAHERGALVAELVRFSLIDAVTIIGLIKQAKPTPALAIQIFQAANKSFRRFNSNDPEKAILVERFAFWGIYKFYVKLIKLVTVCLSAF